MPRDVFTKDSFHRYKVGWMLFFLLKPSNIILLMEVIPKNHLGCTKPCKEWDKLPTSTGAGFQPTSLPLCSCLFVAMSSHTPSLDRTNATPGLHLRFDSVGSLSHWCVFKDFKEKSDTCGFLQPKISPGKDAKTMMQFKFIIINIIIVYMTRTYAYLSVWIKTSF